MISISLIEERNLDNDKVLVKVGYVVPNSPAEKTGIRADDIIIMVGNQNIQTASDVTNIISKNGINQSINISLARGKRIIKLKVKPIDITKLSKS